MKLIVENGLEDEYKKEYALMLEIFSPEAIRANTEYARRVMRNENLKKRRN